MVFCLAALALQGSWYHQAAGPKTIDRFEVNPMK